MAIANSITELIGNTPLLYLNKITQGCVAKVAVKLESQNPLSSVKDRIGIALIEAAERDGKIQPGKTVLIEPTSGNTGIALAMLGAAQGFPVLLVMPSNVSPERQRILKAYGAGVEWTAPDLSSDGAILRAREMAANDPVRFCYIDQYSNDANWRAHYTSTGPEIWRQTGGRVTHFLAGLGTSGTFTGTTRYLKERNPAIKCISLQPTSPFHGIEGLKYMASTIAPAIYDPTLADRTIEVETEAAYAMARQLARQQGLLVGISAAAAVTASLQLAREESAAGRDAVIVTVLPDSADKYLSDRFWEES